MRERNTTIPDDLQDCINTYETFDYETSEADIRTWANRHPAAQCNTDKDILDYLAFLLTRRRDGYCIISQNKIAKKIKRSRMTVHRRLKYLRMVGAVNWETRTNEQGGKIPNEYFIPHYEEI